MSRLSLFLPFYPAWLDRLVSDGLSLPPGEGMRASHTLTSSQLTIALSGMIPLVNAPQ